MFCSIGNGFMSKEICCSYYFFAAASCEQNVFFSSNLFGWKGRTFMKPIQPSLSSRSIKHQMQQKKRPQFPTSSFAFSFASFFVWIEKREKHWDNDNNNNWNNRLCIWIYVEIRLGKQTTWFKDKILYRCKIFEKRNWRITKRYVYNWYKRFNAALIQNNNRN